MPKGCIVVVLISTTLTQWELVAEYLAAEDYPSCAKKSQYPSVVLVLLHIISHWNFLKEVY